MTQRSKRPSRNGTHPPARGGGRRRGAPPVEEAFPLGTTLLVVLLGMALVTILVYAVTNQGSGYADPLKLADERVRGVSVQDGLKQGHKAGVLSYPQDPPVGGEHNGVWSTCDGNVYPAAIPKENATHSLEHGAVWLTYRPDLPQKSIEELGQLVQNTPYRLMSPYPGLRDALSLQAWGRQLKLKSVDTERLTTFLDAYTNGPQAPETGAPCSGGTAATGTSPAAG